VLLRQPNISNPPDRSRRDDGVRTGFRHGAVANVNETDLLMRNDNTGVFELYDISNNTITWSGPIGQVGLEWSVAGFGDVSGNANETDMVMRNNNTGAFEFFDISNNAITRAGPMGQVGLEWSGVGIATDPLSGTSAALAQMTQAMASLGAGDGVPNSSVTFDPALTSTAAASPLAGSVGQIHQT
jgi:hypothetical protein